MTQASRPEIQPGCLRGVQDMNATRTDIVCCEKPLLTNLSLNAEVPLIDVGHSEIQWKIDDHSGWWERGVRVDCQGMDFRQVGLARDRQNASRFERITRDPQGGESRSPLN